MWAGGTDAGEPPPGLAISTPEVSNLSISDHHLQFREQPERQQPRLARAFSDSRMAPGAPCSSAPPVSLSKSGDPWAQYASTNNISNGASWHHQRETKANEPPSPLNGAQPPPYSLQTQHYQHQLSRQYYQQQPVMQTHAHSYTAPTPHLQPLHADAVAHGDAAALADFVLRAKRYDRDGARALLAHAIDLLGAHDHHHNIHQHHHHGAYSPVSAHARIETDRDSHIPGNQHQRRRSGIAAVLGQQHEPNRRNGSSASSSSHSSGSSDGSDTAECTPFVSPPLPMPASPTGPFDSFINDEADARPGTLVLLLPGAKAIIGHVIGRAGAWVSQLERSAGVGVSVAKLQQMPRGSSERRVTVTGPVRSCVVALQRLSERVQDKLREEGGELDGVRVLVPLCMVRHLVGTGGCIIRHIQEVSGARMQVDPEKEVEAEGDASGGGYYSQQPLGRAVTVSGGAYARAAAVYLVLRHLGDFRLAKEWRALT